MKLHIESILLQDQSLSSTAKILYGAMNANKDEKNICELNAQELSEIIGCHRNSVVRAVHDLSCYGIVEPMKTLSIKNRPKYTYKVLNEDDLVNKWAQQEIENLMDKSL